ncbi:MAG: hypothetical protein JHC93_03395 [Parachlamydiales bacterium]|nr:hypothetical protein [Parachlamydiales bacterium]
MLDFFRKNQRYFFFFTAIIIVMSFSFFGTFKAFDQREVPSPVAFETSNGRKVTAREFDSYVRFLSTDAADRKMMGNSWGPNFLNDGVLVNQFLVTGLAEQLVTPFFDQIKSDLESRFERQKNYIPYAHPNLPFLRAEAVWDYFAPQLANGLKAMRNFDGNIDIESFKQQTALFLEEKKFPPNYLYEVLRYQEKQHPDVPKDQRMHQLNLFGYNTIQDWLGPKFINLAVQMIMNSAELAKEQGFKVSDQEARADLLYMARLAAQNDAKNDCDPKKIDRLAQAYYQQQLRILGLDNNQAVKIWRDVLLFRRLFEGAGQVVFQENLSFQKFADFACRQAEVAIFHLPKERQIQDFQALQDWETYSRAVYETSSDLLAWPDTFKDIDVVQAQTPEFVQRQTQISFCECSQKSLALNVSLKETWDWQLNDDNWKELLLHFPKLVSSNSKEDRWSSLENLDTETRKQVDDYAINQIVKNHPEWIEEALTKAKPQSVKLGLRSCAGELPFKGIKNRTKFVNALTDCAIASVDQAPSIDRYTQDNEHFYRIWINGRDENLTLVSFQEAKKDQSLKAVLDKTLQEKYYELRAKTPGLYLNNDATFKPFESLKEDIAMQTFEPLIKAIVEDAASRGLFLDDHEKNRVAQYRFYKAMNQFAALNPDVIEKVLDKKIEKLTRNERSWTSPQEALEMTIGQTTPVRCLDKGDLYYYQLLQLNPGQENSAKLTEGAFALAGQQAKRSLAEQVIKTFVAKKALSLKAEEEQTH